MPNELIQTLLEKATSTRLKAYTPYSHFPVGACIRTESGELFSGCNIENASFGLSLCAEGSAIANMITAQGKQTITDILVIADSDEPCTPCGACRQRLMEFANEHTNIYLYNLKGEHEDTKLTKLLPGHFSFQHNE